MPKQVDYPRASMRNCFVVADAVNDLGGECSSAMAADKLGKTHTSGAYKALVGSTVKYGLVTNKKGQLAVTQLYRDIRLAYNETEAEKETQKAFLTPPLFTEVFERFENKELPVSHFEKLLIREFNVPDNFASRITGYFLEGAKQCGLLNDGNILSRTDISSEELIENNEDDIESEEPQNGPNKDYKSIPDHNLRSFTGGEDKFSVRITGPGMDSLILVNEEEDLYIVQAMLKKVQKKLSIEDT